MEIVKIILLAIGAIVDTVSLINLIRSLLCSIAGISKALFLSQLNS